ncbi:MAG: hypothetical protein ACM33T_15210 [Solirubrobacterales bacterium]
MVRWRLPAFALISWVVCGAAAGAPGLDCGALPIKPCVAARAFAVAETLPEDDPVRERVRVAEDVLAPADLDLALGFLTDDNPDPAAWDRVQWLARARLFDRAVAEAERAEDPIERAGGLIVVAEALTAAQDRTRAALLLDKAGQDLAKGTDDFTTPWLRLVAARAWARIGRIDRALLGLSEGRTDTIRTLAELAREHPDAAAELRRHALAQARKADSGDGWLVLLKDAGERGDKADAAQAGRSVLASSREPRILVAAAAVLAKAGLTEQAAEAIGPWRTWVQGQSGAERSNLVNAIVPVLATLGRDDEARAATDTITEHFSHSNALTRAAVQYFSLGRADMVARFEQAALAVAEATPAANDKQRWERAAGFQNLALARARRGDVDGALAVAGRVSDPVRVLEIIAFIVHAAREEGRGEATLPAIERLDAAARQGEDPTGLLKAAEGYMGVDRAATARGAVDKAIEVMTRRPSAADGGDVMLLADLMWRLDGQAEPILAVIDRLGKEEQRILVVDHLIDTATTTSPETAVMLAERLPSLADRVQALARIALSSGRSSP